LDLHLQYLANVEKQKGQNRAMQGETFRKYMKAYHIDLAFTRAKEDYCDTCIRLSIAVADPDQEEIVLLIEAQSQHATDALTQRLALKSAIRPMLMTHPDYIFWFLFRKFVVGSRPYDAQNRAKKNVNDRFKKRKHKKETFLASEFRRLLILDTP
jgi:hypothetical protein